MKPPGYERVSQPNRSAAHSLDGPDLSILTDSPLCFCLRSISGGMPTKEHNLYARDRANARAREAPTNELLT